MRYTDVLLMFAEAENELNNGPTEAAKNALKIVRKRAFAPSDWGVKVDSYISLVSSSKEKFLNAVLDERKFEFAGENMRWKDLVRNNKYSEVLFYTFLRYYGVGQNAGGSSQYLDAVTEYDGFADGRYDNLPFDIHWRRIANPKNIDIFPNTSMEILEISNPYSQESKVPDNGTITNPEYQWQTTQGNFGWWNDGTGSPTAQCLYSLYGFMRGDNTGMVYLVDNNGTPYPIGEVTSHITADKLPVVRYILPYPNNAILRSAGVYKNYYGYAN